MSNEPTFKRLLAPPAATQPPLEVSTEQMLAAIKRMEHAIRSEPETIGRLLTDLGEMADAIAHIRSTVDAARQQAIDVGALLQDLEARARRMMVLVGPPADAAEAAAAIAQPRPADEQAFLDAMTAASATRPPDRVPTVSDVVSQLGRGGDASEPEPPATSSQATTVAMLEAMVEELAASMPLALSRGDEAVEEPAASEAAAPPELVSTDTAPPEPASSDTTRFEPALSDTAPPEPASADTQPPEPAAVTDAAGPIGPVMPEIELMSSFARMEAVPYLPPEVGTAVIFQAKAKPEPTVDAQPGAPPAAEVAPANPEEPLLVMPPAGTAAASEPADRPHAVAPPAETTPPSGELDLDVLLFEAAPDADPDPAAVLLEPAPWPERVEPPQPLQPPQAAPPEQTMPEAIEHRAEIPDVAANRAAAIVTSPNDPLASLRAMSEEEKIALFE